MMNAQRSYYEHRKYLKPIENLESYIEWLNDQVDFLNYQIECLKESFYGPLDYYDRQQLIYLSNERCGLQKEIDTQMKALKALRIKHHRYTMKQLTNSAKSYYEYEYEDVKPFEPKLLCDRVWSERAHEISI